MPQSSAMPGYDVILGAGRATEAVGGDRVKGANVTFDEFLAAELASLRRYAAVLTGDTHRAEDVLADALLKAYSRWRKISRMDNPAAYVHRIVTTTFVSDKRRWSSRHVTATAPGELPENAAADPTLAVDVRAELAAPLASLPRQQRAAVVLRYYLGFDYAGVGAELGISTGAARTAVSRALAKLRVTVEDNAIPTHPLTQEGQQP